MSLTHGSRISNEGLRVSVDVGTSKGVSGSSLVNLVEGSAFTGTVGTIQDSIAGTCVDYTTSTNMEFALSPVLGHESWSQVIFVRSNTLAPISDYRGVAYLSVTAPISTYFYTMDTRQAANSYILGYQKDEAVNSWLTHGFGTSQSTWLTGDWYCFATTHQNKVFKTYVNGELFQTQTQTLNVDTYGDIINCRLNSNGSNNVVVGKYLLYDRVLTDAEIKEVFVASKGRFGL